MTEDRAKVLINIRRYDKNYTLCAREALLSANEAIKLNDVKFARLLINEFVFNARKMNNLLELQMVVLLLTEFFAIDDPAGLPLFYNIFSMECKKPQIPKGVLMKFIMCAVSIQSKAALNVSGAYLLDINRIKAMKEDLVNEIAIYASTSYEKVKGLPLLSPMFTNALFLAVAETSREELPSHIIGALLTEFMSYHPSPLILCFTVTSHTELGIRILCALFSISILNELEEKGASYSKLHLKLLECMLNFDNSGFSKPIIFASYLETIADRILKVQDVKDEEKMQKCLDKFAQLVQASKKFLYGNLPKLLEKLNRLPANTLMKLVTKPKK